MYGRILSRERISESYSLAFHPLQMSPQRMKQRAVLKIELSPGIQEDRCVTAAGLITHGRRQAALHHTLLPRRELCVVQFSSRPRCAIRDPIITTTGIIPHRSLEIYGKLLAHEMSFHKKLCQPGLLRSAPRPAAVTHAVVGCVAVALSAMVCQC